MPSCCWRACSAPRAPACSPTTSKCCRPSQQAELGSPSLERRAGGEPLAYLLGEKEFHGLLLEVSPAVLVPRPETELLVDWGAGLIGCELPDDATAVDLGTGSGAIALALKAMRPRSQGGGQRQPAPKRWPSPARNAGPPCTWPSISSRGSWWQPFAGRRFHLAISNPPYIAAGDHAPGCLAA